MAFDDACPVCVLSSCSRLGTVLVGGGVILSRRGLETTHPAAVTTVTLFVSLLLSLSLSLFFLSLISPFKFLFLSFLFFLLYKAISVFIKQLFFCL